MKNNCVKEICLTKIIKSDKRDILEKIYVIDMCFNITWKKNKLAKIYKARAEKDYKLGIY